MSYLYKRSNWLWPLLIRHRLVNRVWRPLVEFTRKRHVKFRRRLAEQPIDSARSTDGRWSLSVVSAGV